MNEISGYRVTLLLCKNCKHDIFEGKNMPEFAEIFESETLENPQTCEICGELLGFNP